MSSAVSSKTMNSQSSDFNRNIIEVSLKKAWKVIKYHFYAVTESHYYEALMPFLKGVKKLHYVAELLFDNYLPEAELTGLQKSFVNNTLFVLLGAAEIAGRFRDIVNLKKLLALPGEIIKAYDKKKSADASRDDKKIFTANLRIATVVEAIFDVPEKIYKFAGLIFEDVSPLFKQITTPCSVISLILSLATALSKSHDCYETTQWIDKLESKRCRAFIREYSSRGGLSAMPGTIQQKHLPLKRLQKYVTQIEEELAGSEETGPLYEMRHKANLAYINGVYNLINKDKDIIKNQFLIKFKKVKKLDVDGNKKVRKTFFEKLNPTRVLQCGNERIDLIAENLRDRLADKVSSDKFSITIKFVSFIPSILTTIVSVGTLYASQIIMAATFTTAAAAITGFLAIAAVVDIFYRHYREQLFIESMEELTKKSAKTPV